jgi:GNAT superfamily N-acetyltransferase
MDVISFRQSHRSEVVELIVAIQREEFGIDITAEQQPDLSDIPAFYQVGKGNFWVALSDGHVVGTIALLDIGNHQGALRKMFVHRDFRGPEAGTAKRLLDTLLSFAGERGVREIGEVPERSSVLREERLLRDNPGRAPAGIPDHGGRHEVLSSSHRGSARVKRTRRTPGGPALASRDALW